MNKRAFPGNLLVDEENKMVAVLELLPIYDHEVVLWG